MKNNNIQDILNDLYVLDPSLRSEEGKLIEVIEKLLSSRPDLEINEKFMNELKEKLEAEAGNAGVPARFSWTVKMSYAFSGAALTMLLLVPVSYLAINGSGVGEKAAMKLSNLPIGNLSLRQAAFNVKPVGNQAFGKLNNNIARGTAGQEMGSKVANPTAMALNDHANTAVSSKMVAGMGGDSRMIMPYVSSYKFVYKGEGIKADAGSVTVLKKVKGSPIDIARSILGQAGMGMINLESFSDIKLQNLSLSEDKDFGLSVNINSDDGSISVGQNWMRWQNTAISKCTDDKCFNDNRIKIENVPSDQELIALADSFMNEKSVNKDNLGQPEVDSRWRDDYNRNENKEFAYVPDSMSVIYPLRINDKDVYDEWGNKVGISVNIDIREKKVSGMWGLSPQNYESSEYEGQTDKDQILKMLSRGGMYQGFYGGMEGKTVEVEVGDPQLVNVRINRYENNTNQELIVPALSFPIKEMPKEGYFSQRNIVVPLAKDFFNDDVNNGGIMPMMKGVTQDMGSAPAVPATAPQATMEAAPAAAVEPMRR